jgi:hypothetical protein
MERNKTADPSTTLPGFSVEPVALTNFMQHFLKEWRIPILFPCSAAGNPGTLRFGRDDNLLQH